jgi:hypothetical protein
VQASVRPARSGCYPQGHRGRQKEPDQGSDCQRHDPHEILAQHGASQVLLRPAAPGTGVVAGGAVRILLELAGVKDVLAKSIGASNPVNNAWATINALTSLKTIEDIARLRGKTVQEIRHGSHAPGTGPAPVTPTVLTAVPVAIEEEVTADVTA